MRHRRRRSPVATRSLCWSWWRPRGSLLTAPAQVKTTTKFFCCGKQRLGPVPPAAAVGAAAAAYLTNLMETCIGKCIRFPPLSLSLFRLFRLFRPGQGARPCFVFYYSVHLFDLCCHPGQKFQNSTKSDSFHGTKSNHSESLSTLFIQCSSRALHNVDIIQHIIQHRLLF